MCTTKQNKTKYNKIYYVVIKYAWETSKTGRVHARNMFGYLTPGIWGDIKYSCIPVCYHTRVIKDDQEGQHHIKESRHQTVFIILLFIYLNSD
jgi:hypothetical protein